MLHKRHLPPKPTRPVGYCVKKRPPLPSSGFDNLPPGSSYRSVPPFSTLSNKASGTALATAGPASGRSAHLTSLLREAPSSAWADRTAAAANLFSIGPDCISISVLEQRTGGPGTAGHDALLQAPCADGDAPTQNLAAQGRGTTA